MSAFVDVQIIGFAVGQQQQQTLSFWSVFQAFDGIANGGPMRV